MLIEESHDSQSFNILDDFKNCKGIGIKSQKLWNQVKDQKVWKQVEDGMVFNGSYRLKVTSKVLAIPILAASIFMMLDNMQ